MHLDSLPTSTAALALQVTRPIDATPPQPSPGELDVGIGSASAQQTAQAALDRLVEHGLLANTELRLAYASELRTRLCDGLTNECTEYIESYSFFFTPQIAGVPIIGTWAELTVDRDGPLVAVLTATVDLASAGSTTAAITEPEAEQRFLALARAEYPTHDVTIHTPGAVAFIVPADDQPPESEPVWYGKWITRSADGIVGRPQSSSLALSDADAPLVTHDP